MRILVIEDEPKVARALKTGLERAGYQVASARTGDEGFFAVTTERFDLVLLDLMLPVRNGLERLSGGPAEKWTPEAEVFKDVPHVSRSAQQLAVIAVSHLSLADVIKRAEKEQPGTVYSVIPVLRDRKPVFAVLVASGGKTVELTYDALTGAAVKAAK